jgi:hypothetical protein
MKAIKNKCINRLDVEKMESCLRLAISYFLTYVQILKTVDQEQLEASHWCFPILKYNYKS